MKNFYIFYHLESCVLSHNALRAGFQNTPDVIWDNDLAQGAADQAQQLALAGAQPTQFSVADGNCGELRITIKENDTPLGLICVIAVNTW